MDLSTAILLITVLGFAHSFECPRSHARGLFSNRQDCSKYYQCVGGGKYYAKNCPPGLWFDSRYSICNWPGYVSCHTEKPQIQPLASEEDDPVISGKIGRYPQKLGRQIHTTKKTPTYKTNPTTTQPTTMPTKPNRITEPEASWEQDAPRYPQNEKYTTLLDGSTRDPSPGPISSPQSVLDWLYEDHVPDEEAEVENVHPEAPPKKRVEASPINSIAAAMDQPMDEPMDEPMDDYGGFEEYEDDEFAPPPECAAAFSLMLDPTRCEGFYQCYLWIPYPKVCPAGLLFDHKNNVCNWPEYVYCLNGERYDPPESTTGTSKSVETTPGTPPVPSNNFDPKGNYGYDEENDTNYDDYWPIEGIDEGDRQQTAFKKKIIPEESSQTERRETTPARTQAKTTTFKMPRKTTPKVKCGDGNNCEKRTVQTSDYKSHPKIIKSLNTESSEEYTLSSQRRDTTAKSTTTRSENLNYPQSPYEKPKDSGSSSSSDSKSSEKSAESSDSSFVSSEEEQDGAESKSSEETNDIIEIKLTANNFKSKDNNIQVEIVPVKGNRDDINDENELLQQGSAAVSNATSTEVTEPAPEPTADPVTEVTEAPEADNATSAEGSGGASNGTSASGENSTESAEGSGIIVVLTKIDTLRNSVEKLLTKTKPPPFSNSMKVTYTTGQPINVSAEINETEGNHSSVLSTNETSNSTHNVTDIISQETNSTTPIILNRTIEIVSLPPAEVFNTTDVYETSTNSSDIIVDSSNSTDNVTTYNHESDSATYRANSTVIKDSNIDNKLNIEGNVKTENMTKVSQNYTISANDTAIENNTATPMNNSVNETVTNATLNATNNQSEISTESTNATNKYDSSNTTDGTSITSPSPTTVCSDGACSDTDINTTQSQTKSAASASSKAVLKPNRSRPDIVMLSGKSPIARILEKLLNIRMKQIGNNKFKAVSNKQKTGKGGLLSENKLPASPTPEQAHVSDDVSSKLSKSSKSTQLTPQTTISTLTNAENKPTQEKTEAPTTGTTTNVTYTKNNTTLATNVTEVMNNNTNDDTVSGNENVTLAETTNNTTLSFSNASVDPSTLKSNQTNATTTITSQADTKATTTISTPKSPHDNSTDNSTTTDSETTKVTTARIPTTKSTLSVTQVKNETTSEESATETDNVTVKINTTIIVDQLDANITETDIKNITIGETNDLVISKEASNSTVLNSTQIVNDSTATSTAKPIELNSTQANETMTVTMSTTNGTDQTTNGTDQTVNGTDQAINGTVQTMNGTVNETSLLVNETSLVSQTGNSNNTDTTVNSTTKPTEKSTAKTESTSTKTTTVEKISTERKLRALGIRPAEASRFRLHVKAPHFEARKVFGGPDERWRLSDGTLVDPFSRRQRDINTENQLNTASFSPSSLLLITILIFLSQLA